MGPETPGAGGVYRALRPSGQVRRGESWAADRLSSLQDTGPCGCWARGRPDGPPGHGRLCASRTTRLVPALTPGEPVPVIFPRDGRAWNILKEASDVLSPAQRPRASLGSFTCGQRPACLSDRPRALIGPLSGIQCRVQCPPSSRRRGRGPRTWVRSRCPTSLPAFTSSDLVVPSPRAPGEGPSPPGSHVVGAPWLPTWPSAIRAGTTALPTGAEATSPKDSRSGGFPLAFAPSPPSGPLVHTPAALHS